MRSLAAFLAMGSYRLSDFKIGATIGSGVFGRVVLAHHAMDDEWRAVRIMAAAELAAKNLARFVAAELSMLRALRHPFIVELLGQFCDAAHFYFVFELLPGGDLRRRLRDVGSMKYEESSFYAAQIASALDYLHGNSVAYRNLRPEHVAIDRYGYAKLIGFALAKPVKDEAMSTLCGSPEYVAPEIIARRGYGLEVDAWALGIVVFECLVGYPPFCGAQPFAVYRGILDREPPEPAGLDPVAQAFVKKLLVKDPQHRLSAVHAKAHPYFSHIDWAHMNQRLLPAPFVPSTHRARLTDHFDVVHDEASKPELASYNADRLQDLALLFEH